MKKLKSALAAAVLVASAVPAFAADKAKLDERLTEAQELLTDFVNGPSDKAIPNQILSGASCVVVIPGYKKAAFIVGGQYGQGVATCRTGHGWSAPVFVQLAGVSGGFQIGAQSTELILVAMNHNGLQDMLKNKVKLGADAAASAGPVGRNAQAGTDWKLNAEFLTYSRSKGLFAGIDLDGTVLSQNQDDTKDFYGSALPFQTILSGGVPTPPDAQPFVGSVAKAFVASRAQ